MAFGEPRICQCGGISNEATPFTNIYRRQGAEAERARNIKILKKAAVEFYEGVPAGRYETAAQVSDMLVKIIDRIESNE